MSSAIFSREKLTNEVSSNHDLFKGCVCYIFASLFFMSKRELLWNKEIFLFYFQSFLYSWDNETLTFEIFRYHDVIKCLRMKHETHIIE